MCDAQCTECECNDMNLIEDDVVFDFTTKLTQAELAAFTNASSGQSITYSTAPATGTMRLRLTGPNGDVVTAYDILPGNSFVVSFPIPINGITGVQLIQG